MVVSGAILAGTMIFAGGVLDPALVSSDGSPETASPNPRPLSAAPVAARRHGVRQPMPREVRAGLERVKRESRGRVRVAQTTSGRVEVVTAKLPVPSGAGSSAQARAKAVVQRHRSVLGLRNPASELSYQGTEQNLLGVQTSFAQRYRGLPVYHGNLHVVLSSDKDDVEILSSGLVPSINLPTTTPRLSAEDALTTVRRSGAAGAPVKAPGLQVYADESAQDPFLAWVVELPGREYIVDARGGAIRDVRETSQHALYRRVYEHKGVFYGFPGSGSV